MKYKILTNSDEAFKMAPCSAGVIKSLRALQVASAYYSDLNRYGIAKEQCMHDWIAKEEEQEEGSVTFEMKPPEFGADEFRNRVAVLLFPDADIENNLDHVDHREAEEALDRFMGFIEPRHKQVKGLSTLLANYRQGQNATTGQETETGGPSKKTPS